MPMEVAHERPVAAVAFLFLAQPTAKFDDGPMVSPASEGSSITGSMSDAIVDASRLRGRPGRGRSLSPSIPTALKREIQRRNIRSQTL